MSGVAKFARLAAAPNCVFAEIGLWSLISTARLPIDTEDCWLADIGCIAGDV
jgi:hypothetical protein